MFMRVVAIVVTNRFGRRLRAGGGGADSREHWGPTLPYQKSIRDRVLENAETLTAVCLRPR